MCGLKSSDFFCRGNNQTMRTKTVLTMSVSKVAAVAWAMFPPAVVAACVARSIVLRERKIDGDKKIKIKRFTEHTVRQKIPLIQRSTQRFAKAAKITIDRQKESKLTSCDVSQSPAPPTHATSWLRQGSHSSSPHSPRYRQSESLLRWAY